jgi:hypothetical protein
MIQPEDVYLFRQWKSFIKKISNYVLLDHLDVNFKERNNFMKMHSLIHNQLSSPKFRKLIQFAWHKSGYLIKHPGRFPGVNEVSFIITDQPDHLT